MIISGLTADKPVSLMIFSGIKGGYYQVIFSVLNCGARYDNLKGEGFYEENACFSQLQKYSERRGICKF
jgi:hypothetical protein